MSRSLLFSYRPSRREFLRNIAVLGALTMSANFVAACQVPTSPQTGGAAAPAAAVPGQLARNETLYIAGFQWGPPTTFNPLAAGSINWPTGDQRQHLYETLFGYNLLTGALDPVLAKALEFSDDSTAVVTLQDGTHWQDGTPLTTDDVVYTYELAKRHNDLNYSTFWDYATEVKATGDRTIEFKLNTERLNPGMFKNFLGWHLVNPDCRY